MMRTVKDVSRLTGISVRTLHYYDEIGLLKPSAVSEAGYRLYDDKALEDLQQILFFREFDMPLKTIRSIMSNPAFDRNQVLLSQKRMLVLKKERLERLIASLDHVIGGNKRMDFAVFNQEDVEGVFQAQMEHLTEEQKKAMIDRFGGEEEYHRYFVEQMGTEQAQRNLKKVLEWHGSKDDMLESAKNPIGPEVQKAYQERLDLAVKKLAERKKSPAASFEVKEVIGEYGFLMKQMFRLKDERGLMRETAELYRSNEQARDAFDGQYGEGMADFFADAVEEFYK